MPVYIIQVADTDRVKIGLASNPKARLDSLQTAHFDRLHIIRTLTGSRATERWLHKRFQEHRVNREWFTFHPLMLTVEPPEERSSLDEGIALLRQRSEPLAELARRLNITRAAISMWAQVPPNRVLAVERLTGIPRHVLRPDFYPPQDEKAA